MYKLEPTTILMPCSSVEGETASSLLDAAAYLAERGMKIHPILRLHCSDVVVARNVCAHEFLRTPPEIAGNRATFIDSDMKFTGLALHRLVCQPVDVVGVTYARKTIDDERLRAAFERGDRRPIGAASEPMFRPLPNTEGKQQSVLKGPDGARMVEVERLPTGFLSLSRECLLQMAEQSTVTYDDAGNAIPQIFRRTEREGRAIGEDYDFCDRWRSLSPENKCYLELGLRIGHVGRNSFYCDLREVFPDFQTALPSPQEVREEHNAAVSDRLARMWANQGGDQ